MGLKNLHSCSSSLCLLKDKLTSWFSIRISLFNGISFYHWMHELVVPRSWTLEPFWNSWFSGVFTDAFIAFEAILASMIPWMRIFFVPFGGNIWFPVIWVWIRSDLLELVSNGKHWILLVLLMSTMMMVMCRRCTNKGQNYQI